MPRLLAPVSLSLILFSGCHKNPQPAAIPPQAIAAQAVPPSCPASIVVTDDNPLAKFTEPAAGTCKTHIQGQYVLPDRDCSPGAINPTVTLAILKDTGFKTACLRDQATSASKKATTYSWYGISKPANNTGQSQVCELDHVVPLYLGGADTLDNIWPQCGPNAASLNNRFFKEKDKVELYLGAQVRSGAMSLSDAQDGIAKDWTQYVKDANAFCSKNGNGCSSNMGLMEEVQ
jgi:hypothetical protein